MLIRPPSSPAHGDREALALGAQPVGSGTAQSSKITIAVGCECQPSFFSCLPKLRPVAAALDHHAADALGPLAARAHHAGVEVAGAGAGDERLAAVQDVAVALPLRRGSRGSPRPTRRRARSGSSWRGAPWSSGRAASGARCSAGAERVDHPGDHVVDREIGRGRGAAGRQLLEDDRRIEAGQPGPAVRLADIDAGKAERAASRSVSTGKWQRLSQSAACGASRSAANCRAIS